MATSGTARAHDGRVTSPSAYPSVLDPALVGTYPALSKAGGGFVWDAVLEYRVWCHGEGGDFYRAFASYEEAVNFAADTAGASDPLALVLQREYIEESEPGQYQHQQEERVTEWPVAFLARPRRTSTTIPDFLASGDARRLDRLRGLV